MTIAEQRCVKHDDREVTMGDELPSAVSEVDVTTPNIARIYDCFVGASANFVLDRTRE